MRRRASIFLAATVAIAAVLWPWSHEAGEPPEPGVDVSPGPAPRPDRGSAPVAELPRTRVPAARVDFDVLIEGLVVLGSQLSAAVDAGDRERAEELDRQTRLELEGLYRSFPEPEDRALAKLTGRSPAEISVRDQVRRRVYILLLTQGLERRWQQSRASGERTRLDSLVTAMLATLILDETLAQELGMGLLAGRPYLGLAHEEAVLDLLAMTPELPFLREVSSALLLTLWDNLLDSGARTGGELASLALLFKDDVNPSRRLAALEHLLQAEDGRYREVIVEEICARKERDLARELGMAAAERLEPDAALAVLERLATVSSEDLMPAFAAVGLRDAGVLRDAYERNLADNREPSLRAELVTGAGFSSSGIDLAHRAFEVDPHPAVKARAMLAITAHAGQAWGEETLNRALDDREFCSDPRRLGAVVWALDNLAGGDPATTGMTEAVQRIGARLMSRRDLLAADRERLAEILSRNKFRQGP